MQFANENQKYQKIVYECNRMLDVFYLRYLPVKNYFYSSFADALSSSEALLNMSFIMV